MENYLTIGHLLPEALVGFMPITIVLKHLNEIKQYQSFSYLV